MKVYLTAIIATLLVTSTQVQAAAYNCTVDSGCKKISSKIEKTEYAKTKYPIVLVHGMGGFNSIFGVSYWYNTPENLAKNGAAIFVTKLSSFSTEEVRGEQLLSQVRAVMAITGQSKVNLVGHSQGGYSARYILGVMPNNVASVTTIGSPHKGTPGADNSMKSADTLSGKAMGSLVNGIGKLIDLVSGGKLNSTLPQNYLGGMVGISTAGTTEFNARFPEGIPSTPCGEGSASASNGAALFSWSGGSLNTNLLDFSDLILKSSSKDFKDSSEKNDGIVGVCSSHFGKVIKDDYQMNHFDEINQLFGLTDSKDDPVTLLRQHANRLKLLGL